jgi:hypothetical protein
MAPMRTRRVIRALLIAGALTIPLTAPAATAPSRAAATRSASRAAARPVLPWIEDDLTRGMVQAKTRKVPIFVESWAPW